ncbi:MAG: hypothetical protein K2K06_01325 [Oscillospiraceae bacterium]|nr:hypothetical protein [Oscillospiraceae bacterium]
MPATAILGVADALGKIISEPIKAISRSIEEKSKMKMQMQKDKHALDLEANRIKTQLEQNREIARIDADVRKWHEEINDYIAQKEIERNKKILDAIMEYQRNMLGDYVSIMANISTMEIRLADEAHKFVIARTEDYMRLQEKAKNHFFEEVHEVQELYPDDKEMQRDLISIAREQRMAIVSSSQEMISMLNKDISRINEHNTLRMSDATKYTQEILTSWAKVIGISSISNFQAGNYIEQKNKALLK